MQKELNPELFGENSVTQTRLVESMYTERGQGLLQSREVDEKLAEMKHQMQQMLDQMNRFGQQVSQTLLQQQERVDQLTQIVLNIEKNDQLQLKELSQKFSQLHVRLSERDRGDSKTQEMIDRHNHVLKTYELRLSQLQKLISEREEQIALARAGLNEARIEIAKMKKL